jgi:beta-galactosidase
LNNLLSELCGITVEEFSLHNEDQPAPVIRAKNSTIHSDGFSEVLHVQSESVEVLASYDDIYYEQKPALVKNSVGKGNIYYFGGVFTEKSVTFLLEELQITSPVQEWLSLPQKVELAIRTGKNGEEYVFLLNYSAEEQTLLVKNKRINMLTDESVEGEFTIVPFGVVILSNE